MFEVFAVCVVCVQGEGNSDSEARESVPDLVAAIQQARACLDRLEVSARACIDACSSQS